MRPYVIWSPPWDHKIGGVRALYRLADELIDRGCSASVVNGGDVDPAAIVVYPEIIHDNPLRAERVVRWRLNRSRVPGDGMAFDWQPTGSGDPLLTVDILDHDLLQRRDGPRSGVAYVVRKGVCDRALVPAGAVEITRTWPTEHAETIDLLASVEYVVSFDEFTLLNVEAILLGTPVLLYPTGRWTRGEVERHGWPGHGVAWRPGELEQARAATVGAWDWYRAEVAQYPARVDGFIEATQGRWPTSG